MSRALKHRPLNQQPETVLQSAYEVFVRHYGFEEFPEAPRSAGVVILGLESRARSGFGVLEEDGAPPELNSQRSIVGLSDLFLLGRAAASWDLVFVLLCFFF